MKHIYMQETSKQLSEKYNKQYEQLSEISVVGEAGTYPFEDLYAIAVTSPKDITSDLATLFPDLNPNQWFHDTREEK